MNNILTIDGKIHHLKELGFIEKQLYDIYDPQKFYEDLEEYLFVTKDIDLRTKNYLTLEEVKELDSHIKDYFFNKIPEAETWLLRAYIIGRLLAETDTKAIIFKIADITKLPKTLLDIAKYYHLTMQETKAIENAVKEAGFHITNTTDSTIQSVKTAITQALAQREGAKGVQKRLKEMITEEVGELNRDWQRVAIYETNNAFTTGYLETLPKGSYVIGMSMPNACPHCLKDIHHKVYRVSDPPKKSLEDVKPETKEFRELLDYYKHNVWVGKNNIGKSTSPRKRIDKSKGNTKDNLIAREISELSLPTIPYHVSCRCRWIAFNPETQFVDKDGQIRFKAEDPEAHEKWYKENIEGAE